MRGGEGQRSYAAIVQRLRSFFTARARIPAVLIPRLSDDGHTVTLDLHGARVEEALALVRRTAALAARRGRATLRVVHGQSTSDALARNRTIKHALSDLLDGDGLAGVVIQAVRFDGHALLGLAAAPRRDPTPIRLADVR